MDRSLGESTIVRELADVVCRRLVRRTIRDLQAMTGHNLSGDDSVLKNTWDEICVQVQGERSFFWDAYEKTMYALAASCIAELETHEREAIWLQTSEGQDWTWEDGSERASNPAVDSDIVAYIVEQYTYAEADRWSNAQIREYQGE